MMRISPLIRRKDFVYLSKSPYRAISASIIVQMVKWPAQGYDWAVLPKKYSQNGIPDCRIGYTASKKVGNSVARSRAKRLMREAIRKILPLLAQEIPLQNCDFVIIARHAILDRRFDQISRDLSWALRKTHHLSLQKNPPKRSKPKKNNVPTPPKS